MKALNPYTNLGIGFTILVEYHPSSRQSTITFSIKNKRQKATRNSITRGESTELPHIYYVEWYLTDEEQDIAIISSHGMSYFQL